MVSSTSKKYSEVSREALRLSETIAPSASFASDRMVCCSASSPTRRSIMCRISVPRRAMYSSSSGEAVLPHHSSEMGG